MRCHDRKPNNFDAAPDTKGFSSGYNAVLMLPPVEISQGIDPAGGEDTASLADSNFLRAFQALPGYSLNASLSKISSLEPIIGGQVDAVTPTRPLVSRSNVTSPSCSGKSCRSPELACRASSSPLKTLQQKCADGLAYEDTSEWHT
jgi:hypothetical protein